MEIIFSEEEFEIYQTMTQNGITRSAAIQQILDTCDSFNVGVEDYEDEEEYEEIPETEKTEQE